MRLPDTGDHQQTEKLSRPFNKIKHRHMETIRELPNLVATQTVIKRIILARECSADKGFSV